MKVFDTIPRSAIPVQRNHRNISEFQKEAKAIIRKVIALKIDEALHVRFDNASQFYKFKDIFHRDNPTLKANYKFIGHSSGEEGKKYHDGYVLRLS